MISVKQIQNLEEKIFKAVELIKALKQENKILKSEAESANKKVEELEQIISDYRSTYVELEEGIANAIKQLDDLDNTSSAVTGIAKTNTTKEERSKNESPSLANSSKENLPEDEDEEVEEIKINYSKTSQGKSPSNTVEEKSQKTSSQNGTEKSETSQLDIF